MRKSESRIFHRLSLYPVTESTISRFQRLLKLSAIRHQGVTKYGISITLYDGSRKVDRDLSGGKNMWERLPNAHQYITIEIGTRSLSRSSCCLLWGSHQSMFHSGSLDLQLSILWVLKITACLFETEESSIRTSLSGLLPMDAESLLISIKRPFNGSLWTNT